MPIEDWWNGVMSNKSVPSDLERHVVLVAPEVHWNTGNIGRTCLGAGAFLHLVRPLGFSLDSRQVKRAGLDYWPKVKLAVWADFQQFMTGAQARPEELVLFTKSGANPHWSMPLGPRLFLVFGAETKGLPTAILSCFPQQTYYIPISDHIRCLNLSTAVGIAVYESLRPAGRNASDEQ
jgi:tRNA (cytidine/uridine-2'-O-)-methyltransferase